jgi:hypothetical protein
MTTSTQAVQEMAAKFHDTYGRLAPQFCHETRKDTRKLDLESPKDRLMVAVCAAVTADLRAELDAANKRIAELVGRATALEDALDLSPAQLTTLLGHAQSLGRR